MTLKLGESAVLDAEGELLSNVACSSDRLLTFLNRGDTSVTVQAADFGAVTVTLFSATGKAFMIRINIPVQDVVIPPSRGGDSRGTNSRGRVGTRVGFRGSRSWFDEVMFQEEFLQYRAPLEGTHEFSLKTIRPIYFAEPRPFRFVENLSYEYDRKNSFILRAGDTNPILEGSKNGGQVRGARIDFPGKKLYSFALGGVAHAGARNFLFGDEASGFGGLGVRHRLTDNVTYQSRLLGFEKNNHLGLPAGGLETMLEITYENELLSPVTLRLIGDKELRQALDFSLGFVLRPLAISLDVTHVPDNLAVFTSASRFSASHDTYALSASVSPTAEWKFSGAHSNSRAFSVLNQMPGTSLLKASSLSSEWSPNDELTSGLYGSLYQSDFSPFDTGASASESSKRLQNRNELAFSSENSATLSVEASIFQSSRLELNYQNQDVALGWKHYFSKASSEYLTIEGGISHFVFPTTPDQNGAFFLTRARFNHDLNWFQAEALLQNELRMTGAGSRNNFRAQVAALFCPSPRHDLKISLTNNFEWTGSIYSTSKMFVLGYTYRFGSGVSDEGIFAKFRRYKIAGRVFLDENGDGKWGATDKPIEGAQIELRDPDGHFLNVVRTDSTGSYTFRGLPQGLRQVILSDLGTYTFARLISPSPRNVELRDDDFDDADFIFSDKGEVSGLVFNDLNGNGVADGDEPVLSGPVMRYRYKPEDPWKKMATDEGKFVIRGLKPGRLSLGVDLASIPSGYRTDLAQTQTIEIGSRSLLRRDFALYPERSVHGIVFHDRNGNRVPDPGEKGLDNVRVKFLGQTTVSGEGGHFVFRHLPPGESVVRSKIFQSEPVRLREEPASITNVYVPVRK